MLTWRWSRCCRRPTPCPQTSTWAHGEHSSPSHPLCAPAGLLHAVNNRGCCLLWQLTKCCHPQLPSYRPPSPACPSANASALPLLQAQGAPRLQRSPQDGSVPSDARRLHNGGGGGHQRGTPQLALLPRPLTGEPANEPVSETVIQPLSEPASEPVSEAGTAVGRRGGPPSWAGGQPGSQLSGACVHSVFTHHPMHWLHSASRALLCR
jgi:hypothetical protein